MIWRIRFLDTTKKLLLAVGILYFPFYYLYSFSYMQECMHAFIAFTLGYLLILFSRNTINLSPFYAYTIILFFVGLFRPLWYFWICGFVPFVSIAKVRHTLFYVVPAYMAFMLFVTTSFFEPIPNFFSTVTNALCAGHVLEAMRLLSLHTMSNVVSYFSFGFSLIVSWSIIYLFINFSIVFFLIVWIWQAARTRQSIYISLAIINFINLALLFVMYDAFDWRDIRTMSPLMYFNIVFIVTSLPRIRYAYVMLLIPTFIISYAMSNDRIAERDKPEGTVLEMDGIKKELSGILEKPVVYLESIPPDFTPWFLAFPLKNDSGMKMHYIAPYYKGIPMAGDIHYIFTTNKHPRKRLIWQRDKYKLYENPIGIGNRMLLQP